MRALAYEWEALRTVRFARVVVVVTIAAVLVGSTGLAAALGWSPLLDLDGDRVLIVLLRTNMALPVGIAILAVAVVSADVRRGLVLPALLRGRGRSRVWTARLLLGGLVAVALALVSTVITVIAVLLTVGPVSPHTILVVLPGVLLLALGWSLVAVGTGSIVRHPLIAVAIPVVVAYVVEPVVRTTLGFGPIAVRRVVEHLPFASGTGLVRGPGETGSVLAMSGTPWAVDAMVFLGFAVLLALLGFRAFRRADLVPTDVA